MIRTILVFFIAGLLTIFQGCAPRAAILQGYDFTRIKRIAVLDFSGQEVNSGKIVADEFVRQFMYRGIDVVDRKTAGEDTRKKTNFLKSLKDDLGIDAIVQGTVTEYMPSQKFIVFLGSQNSTGVVALNPMVPIGGKTVYSEGTAFGLPDSQIVTVSATIGVSANLVDTSTGQVVWSGNYTYEGLDIMTATENLVAYLLKSLDKAWPRQ
ncbi:MAG: hypothetical protein ABII74_09535 [Elusimicrobiota bacterium]